MSRLFIVHLAITRGALFAVAVLAACAATSMRPLPARGAGPRCTSALTAMLPQARESWLFVRPRAIYDHPRLGPLLARSFDEAAERALIRRAERTGYDVRTLDRAAIAWTARGTVYFAAGPLDAARMAELLWDRLLSPRRRARDRSAGERMEGMLGQTFVSMFALPACGLAAYAEGDTGAVDRVLTSEHATDPDELLVWHTTRVPAAVASAGGVALMHHVRDLEVRVREGRGGLAVELVLEGPLPTDASVTLRRALDALVGSPLGEVSGAVQWLQGDRVAITQTEGRLTLALTVPWRALAALAEALRGEISRGGVD